MKLLFRWIIKAGVLLLLFYYVPGIEEVPGWYVAFITALILSGVSFVLKPILIFFRLPINNIFFGIFTLVINALLFWFVGLMFQIFIITGFRPSFWEVLILSFVSWVMGNFFEKNDKK